MIFSVGIMIDSRGDTDRKKRQIGGWIQIERKYEQVDGNRQKEDRDSEKIIQIERKRMV